MKYKQPCTRLSRWTQLVAYPTSTASFLTELWFCSGLLPMPTSRGSWSFSASEHSMPTVQWSRGWGDDLQSRWEGVLSRVDFHSIASAEHEQGSMWPVLQATMLQPRREPWNAGDAYDDREEKEDSGSLMPSMSHRSDCQELALTLHFQLYWVANFLII